MKHHDDGIHPQNCEDKQQWEELTTSFSNTFNFMEEKPFIHNALHDIPNKVLEISIIEKLTRLQWTPTPQH